MSIPRKPVIVVAFANDRSGDGRYLRNLAEEKRRIDAALKPARELCEVIFLQNTTLEEILGTFRERRGRVAVFHYGGHADGFQLLLESAAGLPMAADAGGLAEFLGHEASLGGLRLVFLNGCSTEPQVEGLLDAKVAAVIATGQAIDDEVATAFADQFYLGLGGGAPIETAFGEAVAAIKARLGPNGSPRHLHASTGPGESAIAERWPWILRTRPGAEASTNWNLPEAAGDPLFGLPNPPALDLPPAGPFLHLKRFERTHARVFFGRGAQIRDLYHKLTSETAAPIVLLHGQSGVGKSSLLEAGLVPRLEDSHEVCYLRRLKGLGLLDTLRLAFLPEVEETGALDAWRRKEDRIGRPLTVILDQVEEVYTQPDETRPNELQDLLGALRATFLERSPRPRGRLVLGFRKEWLPELTRALDEAQLPRSSMFVERLDRRGVLEAIRLSEEVRDHYGLSVEDEMADRIATELLADDQSAVAPTLQVLLSTMWAAARGRDLARPRFDSDLYRDLKKRGVHLDDFLGRQLESLREDLPAEVDSGLILDVLFFHTTAMGTAEERTADEIAAAYAHQSEAVGRAIRRMGDLYLLTDPTSSRPDGIARTRLAHDTLAPLVRRRFDSSDRPGQRAFRILESALREWGVQVDATLGERELRIVEYGHGGMRAPTEAQERLVESSRRRVEADSARPIGPDIFPPGLDVRRFEPGVVLEIHCPSWGDNISKVLLICLCLIFVTIGGLFLIPLWGGYDYYTVYLIPALLFGILIPIIAYRGWGRRRSIRFDLRTRRGYLSRPWDSTRGYKVVQLLHHRPARDGEGSHRISFDDVVFYTSPPLAPGDGRLEIIDAFCRSMNFAMGFSPRTLTVEY